MKYLVTSHAMAALIEVNDKGLMSDCQILSRGYHYGTALVRSRDPGAQRGLFIYRGGDSGDRQDSPELLEFDLNAPVPKLRSRRPLEGCGDVHQFIDSPIGLLLTDTRNNRLVAYNDGHHVHEHMFGPLREDRNHVNSVLLVGDRVLAMLHNKRHVESQIAIFNLQNGKLELEALLSLWDVLCHNMFVDDDRLVYLASHANQVVDVDLAADRINSRISLDSAAKCLPSGRGHVKGLSVAGDRIVVGVSEFADRSGRQTAQGCLVMLERHSLDIQSVVSLRELPSPIGNINEIRALDDSEESYSPRHSVDRDWRRVRLARNAPLQFALMRAGHVLLSPAVRLRRAWRNRNMP